jgi:Prp8 binding protein
MKRSCGDSSALVAAKRPNESGGALIAAGGDAAGAVVPAGPARTSDLLAPIMLLTGHSAAVNTCKFSPDGQHVLSGSADKMLLLWETFGECANTLNFKGHSNAVLEAQWASDGEYAFSASADKTGAMWDARTGARVRQFKGHADVVNSFCPSRDATTCASASDDRSVRLWDSRVRLCQRTVSHPWQVTAVSMGHDGKRLFTGSLDGQVRVYDLRKPDKVDLELSGHQDIITSLALSPDGASLLSNAMDNVIRRWDVKPYCAGDRCAAHFLGAQHNYEKNLIKCGWSATGTQVCSGSSDAFVYVWDVNPTPGAQQRIAYKLPGHAGSVNEVAFHPTQPIICSCGNDKQIYIGEIRPQNA